MYLVINTYFIHFFYHDYLSYSSSSHLFNLCYIIYTYIHTNMRKRQENVRKLIQLYISLDYLWHPIINVAMICMGWENTCQINKCVNFVCDERHKSHMCVSTGSCWWCVCVCGISIDLKYLMNWWANYWLSHVKMLCEWQM